MWCCVDALRAADVCDASVLCAVGPALRRAKTKDRKRKSSAGAFFVNVPERASSSSLYSHVYIYNGLHRASALTPSTLCLV
eukprot:scaffold10691_cov95-Isochrysis_galbana.AAC.3